MIGAEERDTKWFDLATAPTETAVLVQHRSFDTPNGDLMEQVAWLYDGEWRKYPKTDGRAYADRWRPIPHRQSFSSPAAEREEVADDLHDVITHRSAWREALEQLKTLTADDNGTGYWSHEIAAFDRTFAILPLLAKRPAAEGEMREGVEALWSRACEGREGYCSSDLQDAAKWAISEAFRLAEQAARSATLPAGYQWSDGNVEKFDFGRDSAADAILARHRQSIFSPLVESEEVARLVEQEAVDIITDLIGPTQAQSSTNCRVVEDHLKQLLRNAALLAKRPTAEGEK